MVTMKTTGHLQANEAQANANVWAKIAGPFSARFVSLNMNKLFVANL